MARTDLPDMLLDQRLELTLVDLCEACGLHAERLIEMVEAGVQLLEHQLFGSL